MTYQSLPRPAATSIQARGRAALSTPTLTRATPTLNCLEWVARQSEAGRCRRLPLQWEGGTWTWGCSERAYKLLFGAPIAPNVTTSRKASLSSSSPSTYTHKQRWPLSTLPCTPQILLNMHAAPLFFALLALFATVQATETADKRYLRKPGMPIVKTPPGTVALKRMVREDGTVPPTPLDSQMHILSSEKRYVLQPGMAPVDLPLGLKALKRAESQGSRPLSLSVVAAPFAQRSMPLELDDETLASMPVEAQEKYSRREEQLAPKRRIIIEGADGQMYHPSPVGPSKITPMKRADEMNVGAKMHALDAGQASVHPLT